MYQYTNVKTVADINHLGVIKLSQSPARLPFLSRHTHRKLLLYYEFHLHMFRGSIFQVFVKISLWLYMLTNGSISEDSNLHCFNEKVWNWGFVFSDVEYIWLWLALFYNAVNINETLVCWRFKKTYFPKKVLTVFFKKFKPTVS